MAAAYAAVGNDGMWISPHLVAAKADVDGETEVAAVTTRQVVSPTTARLMRDLLARAVDEGTGIREASRTIGWVARPAPPTV